MTSWSSAWRGCCPAEQACRRAHPFPGPSQLPRRPAPGPPAGPWVTAVAVTVVPETVPCTRIMSPLARSEIEVFSMTETLVSEVVVTLTVSPEVVEMVTVEPLTARPFPGCDRLPVPDEAREAPFWFGSGSFSVWWIRSAATVPFVLVPSTTTVSPFAKVADRSVRDLGERGVRRGVDGVGRLLGRRAGRPALRLPTHGGDRDRRAVDRGRSRRPPQPRGPSLGAVGGGAGSGVPARRRRGGGLARRGPGEEVHADCPRRPSARRRRHLRPATYADWTRSAGGSSGRTRDGGRAPPGWSGSWVGWCLVVGFVLVHGAAPLQSGLDGHAHHPTVSSECPWR